jgi:hypothetical protein
MRFDGSAGELLWRADYTGRPRTVRPHPLRRIVASARAAGPRHYAPEAVRRRRPEAERVDRRFLGERAWPINSFPGWLRRSVSNVDASRARIRRTGGVNAGRGLGTISRPGDRAHYGAVTKCAQRLVGGQAYPTWAANQVADDGREKPFTQPGLSLGSPQDSRGLS